MYVQISHDCGQYLQQEKHIVKIRGPSTEPWGTPNGRFTGDDKSFLMLTDRLLQNKKWTDLIKSIDTHRLQTQEKNIVINGAKKAADKSKSTKNI